MHSLTRQRGITMWGLLFVFGVIGFVVFIAFKLYPLYYADFRVRAAFDSLARQPDIGSMSKEDIIVALDKRFDIDSVKHVDPRKDLVVGKRGQMRVLRMKYEAVEPLFYNISFLLEFDHQREVRGGAAE
jgi:hypothetical protein